jgi:GNAT superfamily N-acetyltransferase
MTIIYRKAIPTDADILSKMRVEMLFDQVDHTEMQSVIFDNTKKYFLDGLADQSYSVYVALCNERIVAMGGISYFMLPPNDLCPNGRTAYIGNVFTAPDYRRNGCATEIMSLLLSEAKGRCCERILLNPTDMGLSLYENNGFLTWSYAMVNYPNK